MVDLEELSVFAQGLTDGADTLVRDAIAELTTLRASNTELRERIENGRAAHNHDRGRP